MRARATSPTYDPNLFSQPNGYAKILKIKGVAARDVSSFTTIDNVSVENGTLKVAPLMTAAPQDAKGVEALRKMLYENPLFINRIISKDGKTTAIYVPLEKGANGKEIADKIREIVKKEKGDEKFYVAGDPVARDTFGAEMFKLMAVFAPIAGMVMLIVRYLMFRDLFLSITLMMDAMISIVWSMGLLIGAGFPIHIMSSMAPVFLMAIATDNMHIFNEFYFRYRETKDKKRAIIETMRAVRRPVQNTALATAVGFGVLLFMHIIPVKVFGGLVAFGTVSLRVLSFSFIPAMFTFVSDEKIAKIASREDVEQGRTARFLRKLAGLGAQHARAVVVIGLVLAVIAIAGISKTTVNNNLVEWFKKGSDVRVADTVMNKALGGTDLEAGNGDGNPLLTLLGRAIASCSSAELAGEPRHIPDNRDLGAGVAPLATRRPGRPHHAELIAAAQERLLDLEHLGDLANREQRQVLVLERQHGTTLLH